MCVSVKIVTNLKETPREDDERYFVGFFIQARNAVGDNNRTYRGVFDPRGDAQLEAVSCGRGVNVRLVTVGFVKCSKAVERYHVMKRCGRQGLKHFDRALVRHLRGGDWGGGSTSQLKWSGDHPRKKRKFTGKSWYMLMYF